VLYFIWSGTVGVHGIKHRVVIEANHPVRLMKEIGDFLNDDAVVIADGGDTQVWTMLGLEVSQPGHMLSSGPFG